MVRLAVFLFPFFTPYLLQSLFYCFCCFFVSFCCSAFFQSLHYYFNLLFSLHLSSHKYISTSLIIPSLYSVGDMWQNILKQHCLHLHLLFSQCCFIFLKNSLASVFLSLLFLIPNPFVILSETANSLWERLRRSVRFRM